MKIKSKRSNRYSLKIAIILNFLLFFGSGISFADTLSLDELIAKTQERYEKTADLKAQFIQEVTIKAKPAKNVVKLVPLKGLKSLV